MLSFQETESMPRDKNAEYFYRYEDVVYSLGVDEFDDPIPGGWVRVELREYRVLRRTPKGVRIEDWGIPRVRRLSDGSEKLVYGKFVLLDARKRFACPTKEEALDSFKARKKKQIRILKEQLKRAEDALSFADKIEE